MPVGRLQEVVIDCVDPRRLATSTIDVRWQEGDDLVVEHTVGRDRGVVLVGRLTVAIGEHAPGLLDDHPDRGHVVDRDADRVDRHVDGAFGDEHVLPEVAEPTGAPAALLQLDEPAGQTEPVPAVVERDAHLGLGDVGDVGDMAASPVGERPELAGRPPPPAERRRRHHPHHHAELAMGERDQRRPHRDAAHEAGRPVDRIDDPTPR